MADNRALLAMLDHLLRMAPSSQGGYSGANATPDQRQENAVSYFYGPVGSTRREQYELAARSGQPLTKIWDVTNTPEGDAAIAQVDAAYPASYSPPVGVPIPDTAHIHEVTPLDNIPMASGSSPRSGYRVGPLRFK